MKRKYLLPRSAKGQSLVELAISLVILLYLLSGAVEFGIIFFQFVQLRDAVQEGALYGSICDCAEADISARAQAASDKPIDLTTVTFNVGVEDSMGVPRADVTDACEGDAITVSATFNHQVFMPFMSTFIGPTIPLNASVTDTVLTPVCP